MPDCDDPDGLRFNPIEEPIRRDHNLSIRQLREFRNQPPRLRIPTQPSKHAFGPKPELARRLRVVAVNVGQGRQELKTARRREPNPHRAARPRSASASFKTSSKS